MNRIEAISLIREQERIDGVAGKKQGEPVELRSRATILSTGGFSANTEMVRQYIGPQADQCKLRGSKSYTGDGCGWP